MKRKLKPRFYVFCVTLLLIILICIFFAYTSSTKNNSKSSISQEEQISVNEFPSESSENVEAPNENTSKESTSIKVSVIGDIMCHNTQYQDAYNSSTGEYDFSYVFEDIKQYIADSDLAIGNLETTFAGPERGYTSYPTFNTPEALATDLKELGIDVVSTANNHSLDKGYSGIVSTLDYLDEVDILHTGTYRNEEESEKILVKNVNGINFAFLAYTYGTNGIPVPSNYPFCINLIDKDKIKQDLEKAKSLGVDVICVNMHWGIEYRQTPNEEQEDLADFLFENGADMILGSHPHVLEKMEKREITLEDGSKKDGFLIYSLGNFISGQVKDYTKQSVILDIKITKNENNKISIDSVDYHPVYMYKGTSGKKFKLMDIEKERENYENGSSNISASLYNTLSSEVSHIYQIVGEPIN